MITPRHLFHPLLSFGLAFTPALLRSAPAHDPGARAFLERYCHQCHGIEDEAANLDLKAFAGSPDPWSARPEILADVLDVIESGDMPPRKAPLKPSDDERATAVATLHTLLDRIREARRDDPGLVVMPRLTKAEYNRVVRDLTGHDFQPARFFPNDSLAGEGFANLGEAQGTTLGEIERFLAAAAEVSRHLHASSASGFTWFESPLEDATSRDELVSRLIRKITDWFGQEQAAYVNAHLESLVARPEGLHANYLKAAWEYRFRAELGRPRESLSDIALRWQPALRPEMLEKWWDFLHAPEGVPTHFAREFARWHALPAPPRAKPGQIDAELADISKQWAHLKTYYQFFLRSGYEKANNTLQGSLKEGRHPFDIAVAPDSLLGDHRQLHLLATDALVADAGDLVLWKNPRFVFTDGREKKLSELPAPEILDAHGKVVGRLSAGAHPDKRPLPDNTFAVRAPALLRVPIPDGAARFLVDAELDERAAGESCVQTVIRKEPLERPEYLRFYPGRQPYGRAKNGDAENRAVGRAFGDYYAARGTIEPKGIVFRQGKNVERNLIETRLGIDPRYVGGPWPKQDKIEARANRPYELGLEQLIARASPERRVALENLYRDLAEAADPAGQDLAALAKKHGVELPPNARALPADALTKLSAEERDRHAKLVSRITSADTAATARARELLAGWLRRAWRRPVSPAEIDSFVALYTRERARGLPFDTSIKIPLMASLVSPHFLYRYQTARAESDPRPYAIDDLALASRLSFFLWGSIPDEELLSLAEAGKLRDPAVRSAQVRRMLADPRVDYLAVEFAGRWLQFAGFEEFNGPDTDRFPAFTPTLREAMYQEARLFFLDLFQSDRPVTDVLLANHTFANEELAKHYGLPGVQGPEMRRVAVPADVPRGGVLGMGAVLTRYSQPLRTSPVRRGHWVWENLMGYAMPEPPPNVPMISQDDVGADGLSVRAQLSRHREDPGCASCHDKIDPLGVALETFDPVGRWRTADSAGQPVDAADTTHDGRRVAGPLALKTYLGERRDDFLRTFSRKLAGFALGRAVTVGDDALLARMSDSLRSQGGRFSAALGPLLDSPQFLQRRDDPASPALAQTATTTRPTP